MEVINFKKELRKVKKEVKRNSHFCISDNPAFRYILGSIKDNPLIVMGINPSIADSNQKDNTTKRVEKIITNNKFDSYVMFNVCAARQTNLKDFVPNKLDLEKLHKQNKIAFKWLLHKICKKGKQPIIWAAWGVSLTDYPLLKSMFVSYLKDIEKISRKYNIKWKTVKTTKFGHPNHPLPLNSNSTLIDFNIDEYINSLNG